MIKDEGAKMSKKDWVIRNKKHINIKTGRKNQIRVHMRENNTPVVGDSKYGNKNKGRMMLHAYKLELVNPENKKKLIFETNIPNDFILR